MQSFKLKKAHWLSLYAFFLIAALVLVWFSQSSINAYWQQTYHKPSPIQWLDDFAWWRKGAELNQQFTNELRPTEKNVQQGVMVSDEISAEIPSGDDVQAVENHAEIVKSAETVKVDEVNRDDVNTQETVENLHIESQIETSMPLTEDEDSITLNADDVVFFAGDSLMQGVAPYVQKWLSDQQIKSLNLSKQSTGLTYPKFFDWPSTIREELQKDLNIKVLVMFLGANDPWDMPNPDNPKGQYLRFKSAEWEQIYRERIRGILADAKQSNVKVIWLEVPYMKPSKLKNQMHYLNDIYRSESEGNALFIPLEDLMSDGKKAYSDSIIINGKMTRVRAKDGIHFTPSGQRFIAEQIKQHLHLR